MLGFRVDGLRNNGPGALTIENNVQSPRIPDIAGVIMRGPFTLPVKRVSRLAPFSPGEGEGHESDTRRRASVSATIFVQLHFPRILLQPRRTESLRENGTRGANMARTRSSEPRNPELCFCRVEQSELHRRLPRALTGSIGDSRVCLSSFVIDS